MYFHLHICASTAECVLQSKNTPIDLMLIFTFNKCITRKKLQCFILQERGTGWLRSFCVRMAVLIVLRTSTLHWSKVSNRLRKAIS